jgi:hypothetical protein
MARHSEQLEHEAEQARSELAYSLEALRARMTPRQIAEEAMDYVRETPVGQFARNMSRDVQANPMPLVLVFAAVGWACIAAAIRSKGRMIARESASAEISVTEPSLAAQPEMFAADERWGVERVGEPVE